MYLHYGRPRSWGPDIKNLALHSYLLRLQTSVQLTCDVQLSLMLTAFIWTYTKIVYMNSVVILRAHDLSSFRQEIIWFYSEATGHMMERHIRYKTTVVYLAIQYESLHLYDSLQSPWIFLNSHFMCSKSISSPNQNHFFICDPITFTELHTYRKCFSTVSVSSLWWTFLKDASRDKWATDLGIKHRGAALRVPGGETWQTDRWPTISGATCLTPGVDCTWEAGPQANKANLSQENQ